MGRDWLDEEGAFFEIDGVPAKTSCIFIPNAAPNAATVAAIFFVRVLESGVDEF